MPAVVLNIAPKLFSEIQQLVDKGMYASTEQFLEIAAANQLALERGQTPAEIVERGLRAEAVKAPEPAVPGRRTRPAKSVGRRKNRKSVPPPSHMHDVIVRVAYAKLSNPNPPFAEATRRPPDDHLWGQVNRLFPLKLTCRWLAVTSGNSREWPVFETIANQLAGDAAVVGAVLSQMDAEAGRKRDEVLGTGLPRPGNPASQDRFLSQFVARATRAGDIYPGAVCQYALAAFDGDRIALTKIGREFAELHNPVLDAMDESLRSTLSDEERRFLLSTLLQFVPGELSDFRTILSAIKEGHSTPDGVVERVTKELPDAWSTVMVRTHIAGVIARLSELGLLARRWAGRNVRYEASPSSERLMAEVGA
jgi:hypothetical protein